MTEKQMALCVDEEDLHKPYGQWPVYLMNRAIVDDKTLYDADGNPTTDKDVGKPKILSKIKQILPYVVIGHKADGQTQFLSYVRGKKGLEFKLHDKLSIGFGGHIETLPSGVKLLAKNRTNLTGLEAYTAGCIDHHSMVYHLAVDTLRELSQELPGFFKGLNYTPDSGYRDLQSAVTDEMFNPLEVCPKLFEAIVRQIEDRHFINVNYAPVDGAHTGVLIYLDVDRHDVDFTALNGEEGQVMNLHWYTVDELKAEPLHTRLEGWSKHALERRPFALY